MRKSTFDDRHLQKSAEQEHAPVSYPMQREISEIFSRYGYKNLEYAYLCSFASKRDQDALFPRYERLYNLMTTVARLKCPTLFKKDTPTYIDDETRLTMIRFLEDKVKADFGKYSSKNYVSFRRQVFERAGELGWHPFYLVHLVKVEMAAANGSDLYNNLDAIHEDDITQAVERTIQYVQERYETIPFHEDCTKEPIHDKDGREIGYVLTPSAPYGRYIAFPLPEVLDGIDAILYRECCLVFSQNDILFSDLNNQALPYLKKVFAEHVSCNPLSMMIAQYHTIFVVNHGSEIAQTYYQSLCSYYDTLDFSDLGNPSTYIAAQYLYSVITSKPVRDKLSNKVGSIISELLSLFGYITVKEIESIPTDKEKCDLVKRFLEVDKNTGLYKRLA